MFNAHYTNIKKQTLYSRLVGKLLVLKDTYWRDDIFLQKPDVFAYAYQKIGKPLGGAQLRYNYYPMIPDVTKVKPGQIRCGEHTDYGGITLLIQDDVGGLEVRKVKSVCIIFY